MPFLKTFMVLGLLTALGYLGNVASLPVAFSVSFLFGSIFVIIAVSLFGPLLGGLSALIASSYTYVLWNHPYAIIIFVCEALWLGFFLKRKHTNIVLIDAAYWMVIGLPLVFIFYFGVMSLGFQSAAIIFLKQAINGIVNALIAGILISYLPLRKWFGLPSDRPPVPYSQMIFHLTSAFLMLPLIGMLLFTNYQESKTIQTVAGKLLVSESKVVNGLVHSWLERHIVAVKTIAELGRSHDFQPSEKLQAELKQINSLFPDFHTVFIADDKATTSAFFPPINKRGEKTIGMNFADRDWFKELKSTLKPSISDVFQSRATVFVPIFTISVPIVAEGKFSGFGLGALNLDKMSSLLVQSTHSDNLIFTIVDRNQNIVCSTASQNSPLTQIKQKTGGQTLMLGKDVGLWTPNTKKNISIMNIWKDATYFVKLPIAGTTWTLLTEFPVAPLQGYLYHATIVNLLLVFCLFVVAIILSQIVSKLLVRTPVRLAAISRDIPEKLENSAELTWPDSNIWEMHLLISNFKETTQALSLQYQHIKEMNIQLEERVRERTAELRESKEKYKRMISNISDVIAVMDKDGILKYKSPNIEKWFGWQPEDLVGTDGWLTVHPDDLERIQKGFFTLLDKDNSVETVEYRYKCKDGSYKLIALTAVNLTNDPIISGVLMNYRDITESKRAEEEIKQTRENYEAFFNTIDEFLFILDEQGNIIHSNTTVVDRLGYTREELSGKSVLMVHPPERREEAGRIVGEMLSGAAEFCPVPIVTKSGVQIPVETRVSHGFWNRKPVIFGVTKDISKLRLSEEKFAKLFYVNPSACGLSDLDDHKYIEVNKAFYTLLGFDKDEVIGKTALELGILTTETLNAVSLKADGDGNVTNAETDLKAKSGDIKHVLLSSENIFVQDKKYRFTVVHDITESKRAEEEKEKLEAQNRQLQKAESLGRMAGAIAHHFNNQLQAVMGYLDLAMDDSSGNTAVSEDLIGAMKAARRGAEVSRMMLVYLGQTTGKRAPMDLSEACERGLPLVQAVMPKNILMETDLPAPGPAIRANANQIQQVLTNLVTNAWESMAEGEGAIRLTVKTVSAEDIPETHRFPVGWQPQGESYACLEVADTGCGIEEQDMEKLFDPFFSTKFTGRGLGLPVVVGIAGAHGGLVTVESGVGGRRTEGGGQGSEVSGSVFRVFFPLTLEEVIRQPEKPKEISAMAGSGTALVIEDEPQVRELTARMLLKLGFTVLEAGDGVEGVEIFKAHPGEIRCVICDLTMPRMDGWETLSALRKLSPGIPVILASGYDEASVMTGDHPEWPQAFLGKPYGFQDLRDAIGRAVPGQVENGAEVKGPDAGGERCG